MISFCGCRQWSVLRMCVAYALIISVMVAEYAAYLSLQRYDLSVHSFEHGFALIHQSGLRRVAGLRAGRHRDEIIVIDVNAPRQPVLVPLLFRAGPAPPRRPAKRPHRPRASVTSPLYVQTTFPNILCHGSEGAINIIQTSHIT